MSSAYSPSLAEFCDILRDYHADGLKYFKSQSTSIQAAVRGTLCNAVEEDLRVLEHKFADVKRGKECDILFLSAPRSSHNNFKHAFFQPRIKQTQNGSYVCALVLALWVEREKGKTLAVRLEPSGGVCNAHGYTHLQLTRQFKVERKTRLPDGSIELDEQEVVTSQEEWLPQSYPAFPLGFSSPVQMFLAMTLAIHGYGAKLEDRQAVATLKDCMRGVAAAGRTRKLIQEIGRTFG